MGTLKFAEVLKEKNSLSLAIGLMYRLMGAVDRNPSLLRLFVFDPLLSKKADSFTDYQHPEKTAQRLSSDDRVFPLETVAIQSFNSKHQTDVVDAIIHTGPAADEFARSMNALAVTVATDIYFRNNAYQPESEEGRTLLAHELTHVRQFTEKRTSKNIPETELEQEAELAEASELYDSDPYQTIVIDRIPFTFRTSEWEKLTKKAAGNINSWVARQKDILDEDQYLQLLCKYNSWIKEVI